MFPDVPNRFAIEDFQSPDYIRICQTSPYLPFMVPRDTVTTTQDMVNSLLSYGHLELAKYAYQNYKQSTLLSHHATGCGIEGLKFIQEREATIQPSTWRSALKVGDDKALEYLFQNTNQDFNAKFDLNEMMNIRIKHDNVKCLEIVIKAGGTDLNSLLEEFCSQSPNCVRYLLESGAVTSKSIIEKLIRTNSPCLDLVLEYVKYPMSDVSLFVSPCSNPKELMELINKLGKAGIKTSEFWEEFVRLGASLDLLITLHKRGQRIHGYELRSIFNQRLRYNKPNTEWELAVAKYIVDNAVSEHQPISKPLSLDYESTYRNYMRIEDNWFIKACERGIVAKSGQPILAAVISNNKEYYSYLRKHSYPVTTEQLVAAAELSRFEMFKDLHEAGATFSVEVSDAAIRTGAYDCLVYAVEKGCPLNEITCATPWDHSNIRMFDINERMNKHKGNVINQIHSYRQSHAKCVSYAIQHGAKYTLQTIETAVKRGLNGGSINNVTGILEPYEVLKECESSHCSCLVAAVNAISNGDNEVKSNLCKDLYVKSIKHNNRTVFNMLRKANIPFPTEIVTGSVRCTPYYREKDNLKTVENYARALGWIH
jgi:hypothetical protein